MSDRAVATGLALVRPPPTNADIDIGVSPGDDRDLESVYRRHGKRVSRWASRLAGPGHDVEDIVHDVFLIVQRRLPDFRGDARLSTWLYEITVRVVQARRRAARRRRWLWPFGANTSSAPMDLAEISDGGVSPLDALERRRTTALLYQFLDQLDDKYRTAVVLFELEGIPCREIAEITGASIDSVWARVSRGREKLIQAFAKWEVRGDGRNDEGDDAA